MLQSRMRGICCTDSPNLHVAVDDDKMIGLLGFSCFQKTARIIRCWPNIVRRSKWYEAHMGQ